MLFDVVVDTNVFLHSVDPRQAMCVAAQQFLNSLREGKTHLCIDEGFSLDESRNRSIIGSEYFDKIRFVNPAFQIIVALGRGGKILQLSRVVDAGMSRTIIQLVPDKTDRVFIRVCCNSQCLTFVSHDFCDLPQGTRQKLRTKVGVRCLTARDARGLV